MENSRNIYDMPEELNVKEEILTNRNSKNGLLSSLQNQHISCTVNLTWVVAVIFVLVIGSVVTYVGLMKLSVLEDDQKMITKSLITLVQGIK